MPARSVTEIYAYLHQIAPAFAQQIADAVAVAYNEAEFEREMNAAIAGVTRELGVELAFRQEYTLAPGRPTPATRQHKPICAASSRPWTRPPPPGNSPQTSCAIFSATPQS